MPVVTKAAPSSITERRIYYFRCSECGKDKRQTFKKGKAREAMCRSCKSHKPDPNQRELFSIGDNQDERGI